MIITAAGIGMFSAVVSVFFSYSYNWPSGATIVLACTRILSLLFYSHQQKEFYFRKEADR